MKRSRRFSDEIVTMAHGAGGSSSAALFDAVFGPAFSNPAFPNPALDAREDGAVLDLPPGRVVVTTDSFVVRPRRFPGGSLGHLAVHGTINDLASMGARPIALTAAFVLEEGLAISELRELVADLAHAAADAGVPIVAGDTKVVEHGAADGVYITTTGIGVIPAEWPKLSATSVQAGDAVLVSGTIGDHGIAVLLARGDLALEADLASDTAAVHDLAACLLDAIAETRWLRDPTRGGVASALNELVELCGLSIELEESALPVLPAVAGASEMLGLDPLYIANEGKLIAIVSADAAETALALWRNHPLGANSAIIGRMTDSHDAMVVARTPFGGTRVVDLLVGDPLPRIC